METTFFVVYDLPVGECQIKTRVKNNIWTNDNPNGWTFQDLGSPNYQEFDSLEAAKKARDDFYNGK